MYSFNKQSTCMKKFLIVVEVRIEYVVIEYHKMWSSATSIAALYV